MAVAVALGAGLWTTRALSQDVEAPSGLSATPLSPTAVELDWKASENADSYVVTVGPDRTLVGPSAKKITATATQLKLSDLAASNPGIDQFYRVDAIKDDKVASSRTGRFTLKTGVVSKLAVDKVAADGVRVRWAKVPNARQFEVAVARDAEFTKNVTAVRTLKGGHSFVTRGLSAGTTYWLMVRPVNGDQVGAFSKPVKFRTSARETAFRIAAWNVCSEKCSGYAGRARIAANFLNASKVDMFGLQEAGGVRVGRTTNAVFSGGSQGFVRASGGAKARYIFFRPALFRQLSGGYFAVGHGRHATWAKFEVKRTKQVFFFVDVHLENGKGNDGKRAAETDVMLSRMAAINDTGKPIIYGGDFNSGRHRPSDSPGAKMRGAGLQDAVQLAKSPINAGINTSHSFGSSVLRSGAHVDHIFVSRQFDVREWKQLVRLSGSGYARPVVSDHNAVSAVVVLDSPRTSVGEPTGTTTVSGLATSLR